MSLQSERLSDSPTLYWDLTSWVTNGSNRESAPLVGSASKVATWDTTQEPTSSLTEGVVDVQEPVMGVSALVDTSANEDHFMEFDFPILPELVGITELAFVASFKLSSALGLSEEAKLVYKFLGAWDFRIRLYDDGAGNKRIYWLWIDSDEDSPNREVIIDAPVPAGFDETSWFTISFNLSRVTELGELWVNGVSVGTDTYDNTFGTDFADTSTVGGPVPFMNEVDGLIDSVGVYLGSIYSNARHQAWAILPAGETCVLKETEIINVPATPGSPGQPAVEGYCYYEPKYKASPPFTEYIGCDQSLCYVVWGDPRTALRTIVSVPPTSPGNCPACDKIQICVPGQPAVPAVPGTPATTLVYFDDGWNFNGVVATRSGDFTFVYTPHDDPVGVIAGIHAVGDFQPNGYNHLTHAIYTDGTLAQAYESGTPVGPIQSWANGETLSIVRTGNTIEYYIDGGLFYTSLVSYTEADAQVGFSLYSDGDGFCYGDAFVTDSPQPSEDTIQFLPTISAFGGEGNPAQQAEGLLFTLTGEAYDSLISPPVIPGGTQVLPAIQAVGIMSSGGAPGSQLEGLLPGIFAVGGDTAVGQQQKGLLPAFESSGAAFLQHWGTAEIELPEFEIVNFFVDVYPITTFTAEFEIEASFEGGGVIEVEFEIEAGGVGDVENAGTIEAEFEIEAGGTLTLGAVGSIDIILPLEVEAELYGGGILEAELEIEAGGTGLVGRAAVLEAVLPELELQIFTEATEDAVLEIELPELVFDYGLLEAELPQLEAFFDASEVVIESYQAWVTNLKTQGITRYPDYDFDYLVRHDGKQYVVKSDGIYEVGADDDDGSAIDATFIFPPSDYGIQNEKRAPRLYLHGKVQDNIEVGVTFDQGSEVAVTALINPGLNYHRAKLARGPKGHRVQYRVSNTNGADMVIEQVDLLLDNAGRKR